MKRILIVEDDPVAGAVFQKFFQARGFYTELVRNGLAGLERVTVDRPDVVVLDLMMPKLGGIEVLKRLRADESLKTLPVIVITNACVPAFIDQAVAAGANKVLDKTQCSPEEMVEAVHILLASQSDAPNERIA